MTSARTKPACMLSATLLLLLLLVLQAVHRRIAANASRGALPCSSQGLALKRWHLLQLQALIKVEQVSCELHPMKQ